MECMMLFLYFYIKWRVIVRVKSLVLFASHFPLLALPASETSQIALPASETSLSSVIIIKVVNLMHC